MSEKDEVLKQISEIKNHLVDKETFFPYNFNACHVWSAIAVVLTKKVNQSYDIDDCTRRQEFIMKNFIMIDLFLIVFSAVLAMYELYVPILLLWLALISLGFMTIGFVLNAKDYERLAFFNISMALVLLIVGASFNLLEDTAWFLTVVQAVIVFGLAVAPSLLAIKQQKNQKEICGV